MARKCRRFKRVRTARGMARRCADFTSGKRRSKRAKRAKRAGTSCVRFKRTRAGKRCASYR